MRKFNAVLIFFFSLFLFSEQRIEYYAGSVVYDNITKTAVLIDSVTVKGSDYTISSDSMVIFQDSNKLTAHGSVILLKGEMELRGDSARFDYETEKGVFYNASTKVDKGYFKGAEVRNATDTKYDINNGYFTTCDLQEPHYRFFSNKIYLYTEDRVVLFPVVMFLSDVPVFALPAFVFPIATKRKSGFLMPKVGYDNLNGLYVKNISYFWAANDFSDMTFTGDIIQNKGYLLYYEARVLVKPYVDFNLLLNYVNETGGEKRWSATGDYSHALPYGISLKSKIDYSSDISIEQDYSDTTTVALKRTAQTFVSLTKSFGKYSSFVSFQRDQNFAVSSIRTSLPLYTGYLSRIKMFSAPLLFGNGVFFNHSHSFGNIIYEDTISTARFTTFGLNNKIDTYYKWFSYLNFSPAVSANYSRSSRDSSSTASYSAYASVSTQIYGTSMFGLGSYKKFRHTFSPDVRLSTTAAQKLDYEDLFATDTITNDRTATFSVNNLFEGRRGEISDVLLRSIASVTYDFDSDSLSNITFSNTIFPNWFINGGVSGSYNIYSKKTKYQISASAGGSVYNPFNETNDLALRLSNTVEYDGDSISSSKINAGASFKIGKNLYISGSTLYDIENRIFISSSVQLDREIHCWKASFRVSQYGELVKYDFSITLTDIPEISIDKGILGPLFL